MGEISGSPPSEIGGLRERFARETPSSMFDRARQTMGEVTENPRVQKKLKEGPVKDPILREPGPGKTFYLDTNQTEYWVLKYGGLSEGKQALQISQEVPVEFRGATIGKQLVTERFTVYLARGDIRNSYFGYERTEGNSPPEAASVALGDQSLDPRKSELLRQGLDSFQRHKNELLRTRF